MPGIWSADGFQPQITHRENSQCELCIYALSDIGNLKGADSAYCEKFTDEQKPQGILDGDIKCPFRKTK